MATIWVNPLIKHAILVEPTRIVGRTLQSDGVAIEVAQPISRLLGGYVAYFSMDLPFAVDRGRGWEQGHALVLLQPYQQHRLRRCHGLRTILIEPESVCPTIMDDDRWRTGTAANARWIASMQRGFDEWERLGIIPDRSVDQLVFGRDLPSRKLDQRIAAIVDILAKHPSRRESSVTALAQRAGISPSRLSHLFREEIGIPIRSFRAWKRIRNSMALAASEPVLLNAALDAGYADEPHFSRSMRTLWPQRMMVL
jgi:AraC-like DNA-binding protein